MLSAFLLAGCGLFAEDTRPDETVATPDPQPTPTEQISLVDLGIDDWPSATAEQFPEPPPRPDGVEAQEYDRMVSVIQTWALQAATEPEAVGEGLPEDLTDAIRDSVADQTSPALASGTVLDPGLDVVGTRMTSAWKLESPGDELQLSLQTRTAYEVTAPDGPIRVIGVLRTQGLVTTPDAEVWGTVMGWQEFGAADCAIALDDFLTPGGDADDQETDLTVFAEIGNGDEAISPALPEGEQVDEDFKRTCEAGRV